MESFDLAVIGSGPGGYVAAIRGAQLGMRVALVEKEATLGGTCLNVGCIPSKALLEASELFYVAKNHFPDFGINVGSLEVNIKAMMARKEGVVKVLTDGVKLLMRKNKVSVFEGLGALRGGGEVVVRGQEERSLQAKNILLAMGSVPVALPFLPFDGQRVVTSTEALAFEGAPDHLLVVGAGAVGLEMASIWSRLGSRVTVIELLPRIAPFADAQMSKALERSLKAQGLDLRVGVSVQGAEVQGDGVVLRVVNKKGQPEELRGDKVLVAVGRRALSQGLEESGVELDEKGRVRVDERFRTTVEGVYAIGDLIPGLMLAHKASEEGIAAVEMMAGKAGHVNYETIAGIIYTSPELAQVGATEEELKERNIPYRVGRFNFKANGRARCMGEAEGLVKVLAQEKTDRLLGVHIVGPKASELIGEAVALVEFQGSAEDLGRMIHAHPTLSEAMKEAALGVSGLAIHG